MNGQKKEGQEWWSESVLYNFDFASALLSRFFYPHGISTNPSQVFIGKEDWLYLGEQYEKTVAQDVIETTVQDAEIARMIGSATKSWDQWLNLQGRQACSGSCSAPTRTRSTPSSCRTGRSLLHVYNRYITGQCQQGALC